MSVQPGSDCRAADGQIVKTFDGHPDALDVAFQQACPAGKLLPHGERGSVLQVSTADLHNILKFLCFGVDFIMYFFNCRNSAIMAAAAAMCMAAGNVSLEDCDMLTWSLG